MATAKIKYVGLKERETAFSVETGVVWTPDAVESVDLKHVAAMLKHPDVFALADEPETVSLAAAKPVAKPGLGDTLIVPRLPNGTQPPQPTLESMTREQLHALAKERGVKVHHTSGAAKVIEALQDAFNVKPE